MNLGSFAVGTIMQARTDPTMDASRVDMISERDGHPSRGSLLLITKGREMGHHIIINLDRLRTVRRDVLPARVVGLQDSTLQVTRQA